MNRSMHRRDFLTKLGLSAGALPFVMNLPSLGFETSPQRKKRLIVMFSPNGVVPGAWWPEKTGTDFELRESLQPLAPFKDQMMMLHGVHDKLQGDGDRHMRGMGCLLTGIELFPGNIQGGSDTPAGWSMGISIDQEIKNQLQANPATRTRFGSLEFGVMVPDRADTWTRMSYAGGNKPLAPIDDPYQMFARLYGQLENRESLASILDELQEDLKTIKSNVSAADRQLLEEQTTFVREMELELREAEKADVGHAVPTLEPGVREENDNIPRISKMQIELLVNSFSADFSRIATLQYTNSVGQAKMRWLGIEEGHHELSHEPDENKDAQDKLTKINKWFAEQLAHLVKRLQETPEPGGDGSLLDNTMIVWGNELGKGNSHTLNDIPFVLMGGGFDFKMGRALECGGVPHNRLLLTLAHQFGHRIEKFGNPDLCAGGALNLS